MGGFFFTLAAGLALGFLWATTGQNRAAAAFFAVNASVWEQMKLLFFPVFFLSMIEVFLRGGRNFLAVRGISLWAGTMAIPILTYTYAGVFGGGSNYADRAVFVISAALVFSLDFFLSRTGRFTSGWQQAAGLAAMWALALLFVQWTYRPPTLPLFFDAAAKVYGSPH
jgi:hypothetical protein